MLKTGFLQSRKQKTKQGFNCSLQLPDGGYTEDGAGAFSEVHSERTRGKDQKLQEKFQLHVRGEKKVHSESALTLEERPSGRPWRY